MKSFLVISLLIAVVSAATTTKKPVVGGKIDADVNSVAVKDVARFAYNMISASLNTAHALKQGKVMKAQTQVVSGVMYYLTIEVEETDCAKTVADLDNCKVIATKKCEAEVLSRPWDPLHKKQLVKYACQAAL